jgi:hypothetical protein
LLLIAIGSPPASAQIAAPHNIYTPYDANESWDYRDVPELTPYLADRGANMQPVAAPGDQADGDGDERDRIFYPTWNRTPSEWLAPFDGALGEQLEVLDHRLDAEDDAEAYPQYRRDGDAQAFAAAYVRFVRAVTEEPFFRWLDPDRPAADRAAVVEEFYRRLEGELRAHPEAAAVWHVMSLRLRRRQRH